MTACQRGIEGKSEGMGKVEVGEVYVPTIQVQLVQTIMFGAGESVVAEGKLVGEGVGGERVQFSGDVENEDESTRTPQQVMLLQSDRQLQRE